MDLGLHLVWLMARLLNLCHCQGPSPEIRKSLVRFGSFFRTSDRKLIQRYRCKLCLKTFSEASLDICFKQIKRQLNSRIATDLVSGVSQRRLAKNLKLNRKTIVRKFMFLAQIANQNLSASQLSLDPCQIIEFDDLETFEHTKLKPLSVTLAVEHRTRRILGFAVAQMPAKGLLVQKSLKKYGPRKDHRRRARKKLFKAIKPLTADDVTIKSDQNPHYPADVKRFFPNATHVTFKGRRGAIVGQGELKKVGFDPLFSLNHTCAMLRANINRLFRKTWCTTKKPDRLGLHIALYSAYHNAQIDL